MFAAAVCFIYLCLLTASGKSAGMDEKRAMDYMKKFGYVDRGGSSFRAAIMRFQRFFHLKITGRLDEQTKKEMLKPRCGNADKVGTRSGALGFKTASKWGKTTLTYRFIRASRDVSESVMKATFRKAFKFWSDETSLKFREVTSGNCDFTIMFASRNHGDIEPFDGPGSVLAHAYFPSDGRIHFDEDEKYGVNGAKGTIDLLAVAVHEIGHAIGLDHSEVERSIMWPNYSGYNSNLKLHSDDIAGAQSLYGSSCSDKLQSCHIWSTSGCCWKQQYRSFMKKYCRKTCNFCNGS